MKTIIREHLHLLVELIDLNVLFHDLSVLFVKAVQNVWILFLDLVLFYVVFKCASASVFYSV